MTDRGRRQVLLLYWTVLDGGKRDGDGSRDLVLSMRFPKAVIWNSSWLGQGSFCRGDVKGSEDCKGPGVEAGA
jgi:hypothetical protein